MIFLRSEMRDPISIHGYRIDVNEAMASREVAELAASIRNDGLIHRPQVLEDGQILTGQRRTLAMMRLGWRRIPVDVMQATPGMEDLDIAARVVAENLFREHKRKRMRKQDLADYFVICAQRTARQLEAKWASNPELRPKDEWKAVRKLAKLETAQVGGVSARTIENILSELKPKYTRPKSFDEQRKERHIPLWKQSEPRRSRDGQSKWYTSNFQLGADRLGLKPEDIGQFNRGWVTRIGAEGRRFQHIWRFLGKAYDQVLAMDRTCIDIVGLARGLEAAMKVVRTETPGKLCQECRGVDGDEPCKTCGGLGYLKGGPLDQEIHQWTDEQWTKKL